MNTNKYFNLNSVEIHKKAKNVANNLVLSEARLIVLLGVIERRKIFLKYDSPDIYSYGENHLNLSRKKIFDFLQISRASQKIPELKTEIKKASVNEKSNFSYTKIRTVLPALLKINEKEKEDKKKDCEENLNEISTRSLLEKTRTKTSRELEKITREISPLPSANSPTPLPKWIGRNKIERVARLNQTQEALLSKAIDLISEEKKKNISFEDFLEIVAQRVIENKLKKGKKSAQIFVSEREDTIEVANKNLGVLEIKEKNEFHVVSDKKTLVPSKLKAKVIKRDRGKCVNCQKTKNIQIHHINPKSQGGENSSDNLVCLCGACHSLFHQGYLEIEVKKGEKFKIKYKENHIKTFADYLFEMRKNKYLNAKLANGRIIQKNNIQLNLV